MPFCEYEKNSLHHLGAVCRHQRISRRWTCSNSCQPEHACAVSDEGPGQQIVEQQLRDTAANDLAELDTQHVGQPMAEPQYSSSGSGYGNSGSASGELSNFAGREKLDRRFRRAVECAYSKHGEKSDRPAASRYACACFKYGRSKITPGTIIFSRSTRRLYLGLHRITIRKSV